jgi:hypothetical protein
MVRRPRHRLSGIAAVYSASNPTPPMPPAAIALNLWRGRRTIDCGCGALGARQPISEWLLVRNAVVAVAALLVLSPPAARPWLWIDWLTVAGGVAALACAWTAAHGLAAAGSRLRAAGASR